MFPTESETVSGQLVLSQLKPKTEPEIDYSDTDEDEIKVDNKLQNTMQDKQLQKPKNDNDSISENSENMPQIMPREQESEDVEQVSKLIEEIELSKDVINDYTHSFMHSTDK